RPAWKTPPRWQPCSPPASTTSKATSWRRRVRTSTTTSSSGGRVAGWQRWSEGRGAHPPFGGHTPRPADPFAGGSVPGGNGEQAHDLGRLSPLALHGFSGAW